MKIAVLVPIGRLDKYGYQYHYKTILGNLDSFADKIFFSLTSSLTDPRKLEKFIGSEVVAHPQNILSIDEKTGKEIFDAEKINNNINNTIIVAKQQGYEALIQVHINQYIPETSLKNLREVCAKMLELGQPCEWLYKKYQIGNKLFHTDIRVPWIINLSINRPFQVQCDSVVDPTSGEKICIQKGHFNKYNNRAIIDVFESRKLQDLRDKFNFTIEAYRKINGTYNPQDKSNLVFNEEKCVRYYISKMNMKTMSDEELDATGRRIVSEMGPDFLGPQYLKHYSPSKNKFHNMKRQIVSILRRTNVLK